MDYLSPNKGKRPNLVAFWNKQLELCFVCDRKEREFLCKKKTIRWLLQEDLGTTMLEGISPLFGINQMLVSGGGEEGSHQHRKIR